jgi:hypothetical protein
MPMGVIFGSAFTKTPTDQTQMLIEIRAAIQDLVRKGLVVVSGQRRWSRRTGRYEIVWESTVCGKTFH